MEMSTLINQLTSSKPEHVLNPPRNLILKSYADNCIVKCNVQLQQYEQISIPDINISKHSAVRVCNDVYLTSEQLTITRIQNLLSDMEVEFTVLKEFKKQR